MGVTLLSERQQAEAIKTPGAGSERAPYALSIPRGSNSPIEGLQDFGMEEAEILQFHFEDQDTTFATTRRGAAPCAAQRAIVEHPECRSHWRLFYSAKLDGAARAQSRYLSEG